MKKVLLNALLIGAVAFTACKKDDDTNNGGGTTQTTLNQLEGYPAEYSYTTGKKGSDDVTDVYVSATANGTGTVTWTNDKVWNLEGFVFVNDGDVLTIEAGTVIKGGFGTGENACALIVARGGKIMAEGTADAPIIMTTVVDGTYTTTEGTLVKGSNTSADDKGLWGGLVVLGKADITSSTEEKAIEGISTTETRGLYGGSDDNDNSGVIKYVSVRHGGSNIGAGNEINGITFGGVGAGTTVDYVEVFANSDDGIEFFGGNVNVKHAVVSACGDDSYDYDEGYKGKGQFWLTFQTSDSDRGGEHDGGPSDCETCSPYATPVIYNATYIGNGSSRALTFRDNAGGGYHNSVFYNFGKGIDIEDLDGGEDSYSRLTNGDLTFSGLVFSKVSSNQIVVGGGKTSIDGDDLTDNANVSDITVESSDLGLSASKLSPSSAYSVTASSDDFYDAVTYAGAFNGTDWTAGWTAFSDAGLEVITPAVEEK